ncbi:MAG TPA: ROK family protein [Anaerolineae bacterium]|nr:ROK family protein [Anaerolineae bacterium]
MEVYGGVEAGGTKFVCAIGNDAGELIKITQFPTTTPAETIGKTIAFFLEQELPLKAIGIGAFGPLDINPGSPFFGTITSTPKANWRNTNLLGSIEKGVGVPVVLDTDVNAAAFGEYCWGNARDLDTFVYLTIGTGIGGGAMVNGKLLHGLLHPEMGHIKVQRHSQDDVFNGICPYHGDCLEGLASGAALESRWGMKAEQLPADHPAWIAESFYLAQGIVHLIYILSPQRVILGGGVMHQKFLFNRIRSQVLNMLNNYIQSDKILKEIDTYIVSPSLGDEVGILGAIALAVNKFGEIIL